MKATINSVLFILICTIFLSSCGGGDNTTAEDSPSGPNTIQLELYKVPSDSSNVTHFENVTVRLDNNGEVQKSNVNGIVTFNGVSNGKHDVHIFSPEGYDWHSIYGISGSILKVVNLFQNTTVAQPSPQYSYLSFQGSVQNFNPNNVYEVYFRSTAGHYYRGFSSNGILSGANYTVDINIREPQNTLLEGDLFILEYQVSSGVREQHLIDYKRIPVGENTTNATTGSYLIVDITLSNPKPALTNLLLMNSIEVPVGLTLDYVFIANSSISSQVIDAYSFKLYDFINPDSSLSFPKIFTSYEIYNSSHLFFGISASMSLPYQTMSWRYDEIYVKDASVEHNISPQISALPDFLGNQNGDLVQWNSVPSDLERLRLDIRNSNTAGTVAYWELELEKNSTSVRLPVIPLDITPMLSVGTSYSLTLRGLTKLSGSTSSESYTIRYDGWTR